MGVLVRNKINYSGGFSEIKKYKMEDIIDTYYSDFGEPAVINKQLKGDEHFPIIIMDNVLFYDIVLSKNGNTNDLYTNRVLICKFKGIGIDLAKKIFYDTNIYPSVCYMANAVNDEWASLSTYDLTCRLWCIKDNIPQYANVLRYENSSSLQAGIIFRLTGRITL